VSRATVVAAYDRLIAEGFAIARAGSGTYVQRDVARFVPRRRKNGGALRPLAKWKSVPPLPASIWQEAEFDFRPGVPDARRFPWAQWRRALSSELQPRPDSAYGRPEGHPGLRDAIARHVASSRGVRAEPEDVIVTNGTQQAIDLIARVLLAPGDTVAVEDPGYTPPRRLLHALGLRVAPTAVDGEGLRVDEIGARTRLVYVSPSHQFPLGMPMSLSRRLGLVEWANRNGAAIIEDDYDSEFRFGGRPAEPLQLIDTQGRVLYVGSFSKTMLPTLRLGFVVAPPSLRAALAAAKYLTDWHTPLELQGALARFLADGLFARHVRRMRGVYHERQQRLLAQLHSSFRGVLEVVPSSVGLHLTALAPDFTAERIRSVVERAAANGVACQPLSMYTVGSTARAGIVLGYGAIESERIEEGLVRLRACFDERPRRLR
jgi:GntR family transcriptional regulator / MocR family aminotransferase